MLEFIMLKNKIAEHITKKSKTNCEKKTIKGYKSMSKDKLLSILNTPHTRK